MTVTDWIETNLIWIVLALTVLVLIYFIINLIQRLRGRPTVSPLTNLLLILGLMFLIYMVFNASEIGRTQWAEILLLIGLVTITAVYASSATRQAEASVKMAEQMREQMAMNRTTNTMDYVTRQFDRLADMKAREEMQKTGQQKALDYIQQHPEAEQLLLEYVYTFNRIGAGIYTKALDERTIFNVWAPSWFEAHWEKFETLIIEKRKNRAQGNAYSFFDWLAKEKCSQVRDVYPEKRPSV